MLALAATNVVGVVLFGTLYAVAGARYLPQAAFLACLAILLVMMTAAWVRVEQRHQDLEFVRRFGRVAFGLVVVCAGIPVVVLAPLFWLESQLPPEAGLQPLLPPLMALVFVSLVLVALVNVLGALVLVARAVAGRARRRGAAG